MSNPIIRTADHVKNDHDGAIFFATNIQKKEDAVGKYCLTNTKCQEAGRNFPSHEISEKERFILSWIN